MNIVKAGKDITLAVRYKGSCIKCGCIVDDVKESELVKLIRELFIRCPNVTCNSLMLAYEYDTTIASN